MLLDEDQKTSKQRLCFNIDISGDPFFQNKLRTCGPFSRSDRVKSPRPYQPQNHDQINGITSYIDGSNVYGSTVERSEKLRRHVDGQLLTHEAGGPTLPTRGQCSFSSQGSQNPEDLVAGDERAIVQPTLASIHSLFLNEHNRVAAELKTRLADFLSGMSNEEQDELLFQEARRIISAELQQVIYEESLVTNLLKSILQITYQEFLPSVLGTATWKAKELEIPFFDGSEEAIVSGEDKAPAV